MSAVSPKQLYRWYLLDNDLSAVADGTVEHATLGEAISGIENALAALPARGIEPREHEDYRLVVFVGSRVVAVRPSSIGIC